MSCRQRHQTVTLAVEKWISLDDKPCCRELCSGCKCCDQIVLGIGTKDMYLDPQYTRCRLCMLRFDFFSAVAVRSAKSGKA
jgi:hypothetical protein